MNQPMPTVAELTEPYSNFMLAPRPGHGVCRTCFNLTDGYVRCYACSRNQPWLDAVAPISYSVAHEQLHLALAAYKRAPQSVARRFQVELAAVLWRYLEAHEPCVARSAKAGEDFDLIATVPSSDPGKQHPLKAMVAELVQPVRDRHVPLLKRTGKPLPPHTFDPEKFEATTDLDRTAVLLIDDTWTTGANAQSAAAALKAAGAARTAVVVIGRHVNRDWHDIDRRLRALPTPFDWEHCPRCREGPARIDPPATTGVQEGYSTRSR